MIFYFISASPRVAEMDLKVPTNSSAFELGNNQLLVLTQIFDALSDQNKILEFKFDQLITEVVMSHKKLKNENTSEKKECLSHSLGNDDDYSLQSTSKDSLKED